MHGPQEGFFKTSISYYGKDLSKLSDKEIEDSINDLEDTYAELLGNDTPARKWYLIRKRVLELQEELGKRKNSKE